MGRCIDRCAVELQYSQMKVLSELPELPTQLAT